MKAKIYSLAPMLEVRGVEETVQYYSDKLGFSVVLVAKSDDLATYGVVERDGLELHFLERADRKETIVQSGLHASVEDVDALYQEFKDNGAFAQGFPRALDAIREHPPEDKVYGLRDFIFVDPNGYILLFGQPLKND